MPEDPDEAIRLVQQGGLDLNLINESKYDPSMDPDGAERIARLLAKAVLPLDPSTIVIWEDFEDIVLAHLVAGILQVRWVRCANQDGRIEVVGAVEPKSATVLVTDVLRDRLPLDDIREAIVERGGVLIATLTIVRSRAHRRVADGLKHMSLSDRT